MTEILSAAQVAAIAERVNASITDTEAGAYLGWNVLPAVCASHEALRAQDGRWWALAGRYLAQHDDYWHRMQAKAPSLKAEWPSCPCDICRDAQAALADPAPSPRGAAE